MRPLPSPWTHLLQCARDLCGNLGPRDSLHSGVQLQVLLDRHVGPQHVVLRADAQVLAHG